MNCHDARKRWHVRLDEGGGDPALDGHMTSCVACREYGAQMSRLVGALDELRSETECIVSRGAQEGRAAATPPARRSRFRLVKLAGRVAAALAFVVGASMYLSSVDRSGSPADGTSITGSPGPTVLRVISFEDPRLGISLRGETAKRYLAVARPASQANVQVFWLYPTRAGESKKKP